jgi:type IV pilus assembly protein PilV
MTRVTPSRISSKSTQGGVVLIEALVAILLFSLGVLALAGLQASVVRHSTEARARSEASYVAQKTLGQMWADPAGVAAGNYQVSAAPLAELPDGRLTVESPSKGVYEVTVTWALPGESTRHKVVAVGTVVENQP